MSWTLRSLVYERLTPATDWRTKWMLAARDGFQAGQTAKARLGPPCAVTPEKDVAASVSHEIVPHRREKRKEYPFVRVGN
jgi:hypothetical protein